MEQYGTALTRATGSAHLVATKRSKLVGCIVVAIVDFHIVVGAVLRVLELEGEEAKMDGHGIAVGIDNPVTVFPVAVIVVTVLGVRIQMTHNGSRHQLPPTL